MHSSYYPTGFPKDTYVSCLTRGDYTSTPNIYPLNELQILFFCQGYECDRLLRTRIGRIEGIPLAKAVAAVAAPVEECRGPGTAAPLGDAMDLEPGQ